MPRFNYRVTVTFRDGTTRQETGSVQNPSPLYGYDKARCDVANHLAKQLPAGATFDAAEIVVGYAPRV
ncbi:hypothetical protein ACIPWE_38600 [Streptomyces sp. NPDC090073]|uniref:hypothetical protein n=1 Tax=Streptomyces sp. NPDC090073 TaxID=3365936 RepID=UPI0038111F94